MDAIHTAVKEIIEKGKITQSQIAADINWLGAHEKHEIHLPKTHESTLRKVRQIIYNLRMDYGVKILSDRDGYWISNDPDEIIEYLECMEKTALSQAKSHVDTYKQMEFLLLSAK